jgi:hypothetical protein
MDVIVVSQMHPPLTDRINQMGKTEAPQCISCFNSLSSLPPSAKRDIPPQLIKRTVAWLKPKGIKYFRGIKKKYGCINAVWVEGGKGGIPHLVHFREGVQVRSFMRSTKLCKDWTDHDYDNNWIDLIEKAIN